MQNRRKFLLTVTAGLVALVVVITPVIADEFFGLLTKVDAEAKQVTVQKKGGDEVELKIGDGAELASQKGSIPFDFEKLSGVLTKYKEAGAPGVPVTVTHEKKVVSKIMITKKKKAD
jgi:hypothetical protein